MNAEADPWQLRAAISGDETAWATIVDAFLPQMWRWARSCGLTREDAEDVAQAVWYKLQDRGHAIREPARLPGWLLTTTRRDAIALRQRRDRELGAESTRIDDDQFFEPAAVDPSDLAMLGDVKRRIADAYRELSATCRQLLAMSWSDEYTHQEIADALGRTLGYVGPTRMRCLQTLRQKAGLDG